MHRIYILTDPRAPADVRYVGVTKQSLSQRRCGHEATAREGGSWPVSRWIRKLAADGVRPALTVIEETEDRSRERYWIRHYLDAGVRLLNCAESTGEDIQFSAETRARISAFHKGRKRPAETGAKISAALKAIGHRPQRPPGNLCSPEICAQIGEKIRGRKHSPEACAKISAGLKGKPKSPEHIAHVVEARQGYKHSDETRAKLSAVRLGIKMAPRPSATHCRKGHLRQQRASGEWVCRICLTEWARAHASPEKSHANYLAHKEKILETQRAYRARKKQS